MKYYMYSRDELSLCSLEHYFVLITLVASQLGKINIKNNPLVSAETVRHSSTYIILSVLLYNRPA